MLCIIITNLSCSTKLKFTAVLSNNCYRQLAVLIKAITLEISFMFHCCKNGITKL